jgi:hypothetical protein
MVGKLKFFRNARWSQSEVRKSLHPGQNSLIRFNTHNLHLSKFLANLAKNTEKMGG